MALHGEIRVNGRPLGVWEAIRVSHTNVEPAMDDQVTYSCKVHLDNRRPEQPTKDQKFEVVHRFGDGSLVLASLVLAKAGEA